MYFYSVLDWELGTKILIGNWTLYAPYLMEVNVAVSKNMYKELLYLLSLMPVNKIVLNKVK